MRTSIAITTVMSAARNTKNTSAITGARPSVTAIRIAILITSALSVVACKSSDGASKGPPPAHEPKQGHQKGLANATAMVENAALCEPSSGPADLAACERACQLNHSNSCANWAALVEEKDQTRARALYARSCKGGSGIGCESEARMARAAGENDYQARYLNARRYHRVHCAQGYARSCAQLARLYREGLGSDPDPNTASTFEIRACSLGRAASCAPSEQVETP